MHPPGTSPAALREGHVLVLAHDPAQIAAAHAASSRLGLPARVVRSGREALAQLAAPGATPFHLVCDPAAAGAAWPGLAATLAEPAMRTSVTLLGPTPAASPLQGTPVRGDAGALAAAMSQRADPSEPPSGEGSVAALRDGLARGEIGVHYQPVVRLADRRPVMVEALARWHRPGAAVSPDNFVPLAERSGLGRSLSVSVAGTAATEIARLWPQLRLGVSINLPLAQLLQPDLSSWLGRALGRGGLRPRQVALELTETTPVLDVARLHRVLLRLRHLGFRVLLDDVALHDGRARLHRLPFSGLKLDRSLVERLPVSAHGRQEVRRLVRLAESRKQAVIAEGVSDRRIWGALCDLGVHYAQGYAVGRPLPATALAGWWAGWRGKHPG